MNQYIEEMVRKGLAQPVKLIGTAWAVFRMIQVLSEYKPIRPKDWKRWIEDNQN